MSGGRSEYGLALFPQHARLLRESGITPEVARQRGYQSVDQASRLDSIGIPRRHRIVPGLLIPIHGPASKPGEHASWQYRPDHPHINAKGRPAKYVTALRGLVVDVPPAVRDQIGNPSRPLLITEGVRKVDSAVSHGIDCLGVLGVWSWRGQNAEGGRTALGAWELIALNGRDVLLAFDSDVMTKPAVQSALRRFAGFLEHRGAHVRYVMLPSDGPKVGFDDYLAAGGTLDQLAADGRIIAPQALRAFLAAGPVAPPRPPTPPPRVGVAETVDRFRRWLYLDDPAPVLITAATVVANRAPGDPVWVLLVGPTSTGKTECVQAADVLPYVHVASTITEAALLSGVATRDRTADATGGLLRDIGDFGVLLLKDFTSVLAMNRDTRAAALAALREIHDGSWDRAVGADGGRKLHWEGKAGLIGGVTGAIDAHAAVVGALGQRWILFRGGEVDPVEVGRAALARRDVTAMRAELRTVMGGLIEHADLDVVTRPITDAERDAIVDLATFTARARTTVIRDERTGDVVAMPEAEGSGRLVQNFRALLGGLEAIGADEATVWSLLRKVARDSVPALRLRIIDAIMTCRPGDDHDPRRPTWTGSRQTTRIPAGLTSATLLDPHDAEVPPWLRTGEIAKPVGVTGRTIRRHLEDLDLLGLVIRELDDDAAHDDGEQGRARRHGARELTNYWSASRWLVEHYLPAQTHAGAAATPARPTLAALSGDRAGPADNGHRAGTPTWDWS